MKANDVSCWKLILDFSESLCESCFQSLLILWKVYEMIHEEKLPFKIPIKDLTMKIKAIFSQIQRLYFNCLERLIAPSKSIIEKNFLSASYFSKQLVNKQVDFHTRLRAEGIVEEWINDFTSNFALMQVSFLDFFWPIVVVESAQIASTSFSFNTAQKSKFNSKLHKKLINYLLQASFDILIELKSGVIPSSAYVKIDKWMMSAVLAFLDGLFSISNTKRPDQQRKSLLNILDNLQFVKEVSIAKIMLKFQDLFSTTNSENLKVNSFYNFVANDFSLSATAKADKRKVFKAFI